MRWTNISGASELSELKARLRKAKARTKAELDRAIVEEVQLITASDCQGWFTHCCYEVA